MRDCIGSKSIFSIYKIYVYLLPVFFAGGKGFGVYVRLFLLGSVIVFFIIIF
jgi:hypothetical protein